MFVQVTVCVTILHDQPEPGVLDQPVGVSPAGRVSVTVTVLPAVTATVPEFVAVIV